MKISVSMLSSYLFCSRKLFLQQVLDLKEPPKESMVLGSLRHEIYEFINKTEEKIVISIEKKPQYDELLSKYKNFYSRALREKIIKNKSRIKNVNLDIVDVFKRTWPLILEEAESRAKNIFGFIQKYNVYGLELWEQLTPKIISEIRIDSNTLQLRGIVDKIEIYENGYVPIELKTGKNAKRRGVAWPSNTNCSLLNAHRGKIQYKRKRSVYPVFGCKGNKADSNKPLHETRNNGFN